MRRLALVLLSAIIVSACTNSVQTTSGDAYLKKYAHVPVTRNGDGTSQEFDINRAVREAAAIEPVLEFPARIGLVRIGGYDGISDIPQAEALHWAELVERLGDGFGTFVPINPLIAQLAERDAAYSKDVQLDVVSRIRLVAARQHLDAVLMYEVSTSREVEQNAMAATDFSIITAFVLPSRKVKGEAVGTALLIDVIQGYPYGTVEARVQEQKLATLWGSSNKGRKIAARLRASVTDELVTETEKMFSELRMQLAEQRLDAYRSAEPDTSAQ